MEKYVYRRSDRQLPPASLIVFAALLCGFALVNLFWPKRENSELENRKLAQMPVFSVKTLLNGKWQDDFSTYLQDQVALRDGWINLESAVNALAFGKTEESGILNGKDGWMFTKLFTVSTDTEKQLGKNISAVTNFAQRYPGRVTFLLAPSASDIYPEMLPANAPMVDEDAMLDDIFAQVQASGADVIDMRDDYRANKDQYLYFKTDHHWTAEGAKVGFDTLMTAMNEDIPQVSYNIETVKDFHGTLYSKAPTDFSAADEIHFYTNPDNSVKVNYVQENKQTDTLFDDSFKTKKDKYSTFMGGNFALTEIETNGENDEHVLIIKDSYANTVMPFFADKYKHITMIDMRYYHIMDKTVSEYVKDNGITKVIFLYNMDFVNTDNNFIWLE